jgi:hypothetical protein
MQVGRKERGNERRDQRNKKRMKRGGDGKEKG